MTLNQFDGKIALVTGAGQGLGLEISIAFARSGAQVVVAELDDARGRKAENLVRKLSPESGYIGVDVSDPKSVEDLFAKVKARYGRLDIAVNNAAIVSTTPTPLTEMPFERFTQTMSVNAGGVFLCMQHELRMMIEQRSGVVINIGSAAGHYAYPGMSDYSASKHVVISLTKTAALEVIKHNVRVASVSPGSIRTPMMASMGEEYFNAVVAPIPLGRMAEPSEIAGGVLFLASDAAAQFVGHTLHFDGGVNDIPQGWWPKL